MTDNEALKLIRAQGFVLGTLDPRTGRMRIWIGGEGEFVEVHAGTELHDLACGKLSIDEIRERRKYEEVVEG